MGRSRKVIEVLYDKRSKYEVVRVDNDGIPFFESTDFYVFRDGKQVAGRYSNLQDAIAWAERHGAAARR